jgi:WD40 repeat protein
MPNSINSLSPSFRDYLLLKNLVTDTVVDNGLQSLLGGIGFPASVETLPNAVQPSNSISNTGTIYQELNTILNPYQGGVDDYSQVNIVLNQSTNSTIGNQGIYSNSNELLNGQFTSNGNLTNSNEIREGMTIKNIYVDVPKQSVINLNTQPVPTFQNLKSYIDENNNLNVGGPSTQVADIIGGITGGQGVGLNATNGTLVSNEDIRSTLLGRVLGATGVINDTPLGNIGGQQLLAHVGYNAAFGLQQETLGSLNLNPLTLLQGKSLINLNYSITVPKGTVGKILNYASNILGVQSPLSLLEQSSSIFTFSDKLEYIGQTNIDRANEMLKNSGKGQVQSLINHMRANTLVSSPNGTTLRQGYAPGYRDDRISKGENTGDGINPYLYARGDSNGGIVDFMNGNENSPISSGNYDRPGQIINDGWYEDYRGFYNYYDVPISESDAELKNLGGQVRKYKNAFGWTDKYNNTPENVKDYNQETQFNNKKTLLYKTRKLFETNRMQTLVTGHGVKDDAESQIQTAVSSVGNFVSKGSGVLSYNALVKGVSDDPAKVFCRTWTTFDRYDDVIDLQKNRGLYGKTRNIFRRNVEMSVLEDNGFARINPYKTDKMSKNLGFGDKNSFKGYSYDTDNKRYMFSIENLAWNDNLVNLLACEVGPGDPLSGHRGRIMWFPPYDISFSESTSANWDRHNFIGRGEPMYTYNNTERSGNLSWKIIIDHPNYLNFIGGSSDINSKNFDDYVASFFAGCVPLEDAKKILTQNEIDKTETSNAQTKPTEKLEEVVPPTSFNVYFPNDVYDVNLYPTYEDGLCVADTNALLTLSGHTESIYNAVYSPDGTKVATASDDFTARIWDAEFGDIIFILNGHTNVVYNVVFSPDGTKVATASEDTTAKIWDVSTGNLLHTLIGHTELVSSVIFNPDGTKVTTTAYDNTAKIWDVTTGNLLHTLIGHNAPIYEFKFTPDGTKGVTVSQDNTGRIWDVASGTTIYTLIGHTNDVYTASINSDGTKVVTASADDTARIWSIESGTTIHELIGHTNQVSKAVFSPDGTKVSTAAYDDTAKIWNTLTGNVIYTLKGHTDFLYDVNFNPDGTKVVTASLDKTARIWDVSDGAELQKLEGHTLTVYTAVFSPDGTNVLTGSFDNDAKIWAVSELNCFINRTTNQTGENNGLGSYTEMCYQFVVDGRKTWSSVQCSQTNGVTQGSPGRLEPDRTDFGLNGTGTTADYAGTRLNGKKYPSWRDENYKVDLQNYLINRCKNCKVEVVGYASTVGTFGDDRNSKLSNLRATNVMEWLTTNILTDPPFKDRVSVKAEGRGATQTEDAKCPSPNAQKRKNNYLESKNDVFGCKFNRFVTVKFVVDPNLNPDGTPKNEKETITPPKVNVPNVDPSRLYSECDYFEKLEISDPIVYNSLKNKIKYFQPAFHSTTPEGFNSRLTFLQQCMRQGPTQGAGETNNPNNLAFGRPPVCILRIGDFYHTKVIIESLNFAFEPLVWDLNPEGVGVQPMICNVDMSFSFIGGSSLSGPINKLQNAVSFNYFGNTEIYDTRADSIKVKDDKGIIVDGERSIAATSFDGTNVTPTANQIAQNNNANAGAQPLTNPSGTTSGTTSGGNTTDTSVPSDPDGVIFRNAGINDGYSFKINYDGSKLKGTFLFTYPLSKEYDAKVKVWGPMGNIDIATFKILPDGELSEFVSDKDNWRSALTELADVKTGSIIFFVESPAYKDYKYFGPRAIAQFECPEEDIKYGDIVYYRDWENILEDPCCSCWPNGTGKSKISVKNSQGVIVNCPSSGCTSN